MERIFRKRKMIERLIREGRIDQVQMEDYELMDSLDGEVGDDYNWESVVKGTPLINSDKYCRNYSGSIRVFNWGSYALCDKRKW